MEIGMLWYDDNVNRPFVDRVTRAVAKYKERFGDNPVVLYVHPATEGFGNGQERIIAGLPVKGFRTLGVNFFWLGPDANHEKVRPALIKAQRSHRRTND